MLGCSSNYKFSYSSMWVAHLTTHYAPSKTLCESSPCLVSSAKMQVSATVAVILHLYDASRTNSVNFKTFTIYGTMRPYFCTTHVTTCKVTMITQASNVHQRNGAFCLVTFFCSFKRLRCLFEPRSSLTTDYLSQSACSSNAS